jgi:hypothetical protein
MSSSNSIFGARGDFITSPEISQVFGEVRLPRSFGVGRPETPLVARWRVVTFTICAGCARKRYPTC